MWNMNFNTDMLFFPSQLRKSYGDVYSIFLGRKPVVVLNGLKAIKTAIVIKANDFAGRPQDLLINEIMQHKGRADI